MKKKVLSCALLGMTLAACSSGGDWQLETDYMRVVINQKGYITSMKNITVSPEREFARQDEPSPLLSLYDSGAKKYYTPSAASFDKLSGKITLQYPNGSTAEVKLKEKDKYIRMELLSLTEREAIQAVQWGSYHTTIDNLLGDVIGAARDTSEAVNYSIGVLALDDNTLGGTADVEGDAAPFQYIIHTPDKKLYPLPDSLHEGQVFNIGGDGISDVAFYAHEEPYYRILYGSSAVVEPTGQISLNYFSRDRRKPYQVLFSLMPAMANNQPNHIEVEPVAEADYIGSSVALWGSPDSTALLDVIQNIVLEEGLPHPEWNGKWIKDPSAYRFTLEAGGACDSLVSYAAQMKAAAINLHGQGTLYVDRKNGGFVDGPNHEKKSVEMASGNLSNKEYADRAREKGVSVGRSCITNTLKPFSSDVFPVPSDSLCYQQKRLLVKAISPTDTVIEINDPTYMDEVGCWQMHCGNLNMIQIGKELIHYLGVTKEPPYRLQNVTRGYWKTTPASHAANDEVRKLQVTINYGYDGIIPNMKLVDKVAEHYADICANSGYSYLLFDGQEFLFDNGHGYYTVKRFFRRMFEHAAASGVPYIRFAGSTISEGSWHYQTSWDIGGGTNMYDLNTREWGSATSEGKDLRDVSYANYFPTTFGGNFGINASSTVEQYEHICAIAVGHGTTFNMPINQKDVESCPQKYQIFKTIGTWQEARWADAFPRMLKKQLMDPRYDWHLEAGEKSGTWQLTRSEKGKNVEHFKLKVQK